MNPGSMPPRLAAGAAEVHSRKKSPIGANICGGRRVWSGMQDEAAALVRGHAGAGRGTETNEVTMFAGWNNHISKRFEAGRIVGRPANTLSDDPMRL